MSSSSLARVTTLNLASTTRPVAFASSPPVMKTTKFCPASAGLISTTMRREASTWKEHKLWQVERVTAISDSRGSSQTRTASLLLHGLSTDAETNPIPGKLRPSAFGRKQPKWPTIDNFCPRPQGVNLVWATTVTPLLAPSHTAGCAGTAWKKPDATPPPRPPSALVRSRPSPQQRRYIARFRPAEHAAAKP